MSVPQCDGARKSETGRSAPCEIHISRSGARLNTTTSIMVGENAYTFLWLVWTRAAHRSRPPTVRQALSLMLRLTGVVCRNRETRCVRIYAEQSRRSPQINLTHSQILQAHGRTREKFCVSRSRLHYQYPIATTWHTVRIDKDARLC
jgi:hypothetical protein